MPNQNYLEPVIDAIAELGRLITDPLGAAIIRAQRNFNALSEEEQIALAIEESRRTDQVEQDTRRAEASSSGSNLEDEITNALDEIRNPLDEHLPPPPPYSEIDAHLPQLRASFEINEHLPPPPAYSEIDPPLAPSADSIQNENDEPSSVIIECVNIEDENIQGNDDDDSGQYTNYDLIETYYPIAVNEMTSNNNKYKNSYLAVTQVLDAPSAPILLGQTPDPSSNEDLSTITEQNLPLPETPESSSPGAASSSTPALNASQAFLQHGPDMAKDVEGIKRIVNNLLNSEAEGNPSADPIANLIAGVETFCEKWNTTLSAAREGYEASLLDVHPSVSTIGATGMVEDTELD